MPREHLIMTHEMRWFLAIFLPIVVVVLVVVNDTNVFRAIGEVVVGVAAWLALIWAFERGTSS